MVPGGTYVGSQTAYSEEWLWVPGTILFIPAALGHPYESYSE